MIIEVEIGFVTKDNSNLQDSSSQLYPRVNMQTCWMHQNLPTLRVHFFTNNVLGVLTANRAVQW